MIFYKLSFSSKTTFNTFIKGCKVLVGEDLILPKEFISVVEVGNVPFEATYDEDGEVLTEAGFHKDYAVDILTSVEIPKLDKYLIPAKEQYYHTFAFGKDDVTYKTTTT